MKISRVLLDNYRCFDQIEWEPSGRSCYLVSSNAAGKTALLTAVAVVSGRDRPIARSDFADLGRECSIEVTFEPTPEEMAGLADCVTFGGGAVSLRVGMRASYNQGDDEIETEWLFTDKNKRVSRSIARQIPVIWVPAVRDPSKLLTFGGRASIIRELLNEPDMAATLDGGLAAISQVVNGIATSGPITNLNDAGIQQFQQLLADSGDDVLGVETLLQSRDDLLRQLQLLITYGSSSGPVMRQSNGLSQLAIFAYILNTAKPTSILVVDEPEIALHPHAQRALSSTLRGKGAQCLIATHSPAILDRADPREIVRISRSDAGHDLHHNDSLSNEEAQELQRFSVARTADAYFGRKVLLVEGLSDDLAVRSLAHSLGRDLDAEGITVLALDGGGGIGPHAQLLGPNGLGIPLRGQCDLDHEAQWIVALTKAGVPVASRADLESHGFFVADPDLEGCLVDALGVANAEGVVSAAGRDAQLRLFRIQPRWAELSAEESLIGFIKCEKVFWAPRLAVALELTQRKPKCLFDILDA
jgi:hypothetical protein